MTMNIIALLTALTLSFGLGFFFGKVHTWGQVTQAFEDGERKAHNSIKNFSESLKAGAADQEKAAKEALQKKGNMFDSAMRSLQKEGLYEQKK